MSWPVESFRDHSEWQHTAFSRAPSDAMLAPRSQPASHHRPEQSAQYMDPALSARPRSPVKFVSNYSRGPFVRSQSPLRRLAQKTVRRPFFVSPSQPRETMAPSSQPSESQVMMTQASQALGGQRAPILQSPPLDFGQENVMCSLPSTLPSQQQPRTSHFPSSSAAKLLDQISRMSSLDEASKQLQAKVSEVEDHCRRLQEMLQLVLDRDSDASTISKATACTCEHILQAAKASAAGVEALTKAQESLTKRSDHATQTSQPVCARSDNAVGTAYNAATQTIAQTSNPGERKSSHGVLRVVPQEDRRPCNRGDSQHRKAVPGNAGASQGDGVEITQDASCAEVQVSFACLQDISPSSPAAGNVRPAGSRACPEDHDILKQIQHHMQRHRMKRLKRLAQK